MPGTIHSILKYLRAMGFALHRRGKQSDPGETQATKVSLGRERHSEIFFFAAMSIRKGGKR
jgi:hypothetical protein